MFDDLRLAIALRGALRTEDRRVYEQELQEWELAPGFCSALLRLYASPPAQFGVPERLLAVLCLKNAVARRWQHRGVDEGSGGLADSEKAAVRAALLAALDEPEAQLAAQLLLVLAQVARLDGLAAWPELMPSLLHAAARTAPRDAARGTFALFRVVKMQASRRLLVHRKQFIVLAAELSPRLQPLRARLHGLLQAIRCRSLHEAAAWLCGGDGSGGNGAPAVGVEAALALCKLDRQLLSAGWAQLHGSAEACALLRECAGLPPADPGASPSLPDGTRLTCPGAHAAGTLNSSQRRTPSSGGWRRRRHTRRVEFCSRFCCSWRSFFSRCALPEQGPLSCAVRARPHPLFPGWVFLCVGARAPPSRLWEFRAATHRRRARTSHYKAGSAAARRHRRW